ncbi:hypothetical protein QBC35DRAFT_219195 [Podospora australis]|uniref:Nephrocystin 3-like N-terminal domain-containing protein n=1 Tax=Podospora australis TaxID=1536484 RepID=A0AAN6WTH1_9PEZI|nr:hypothetical protein QBC35DRAFT_219195 [Podospora australis]
MKLQVSQIKSGGLTLVYEPDGLADPAVDIVLVHGIGGHPVRSWTCRDEGQTPMTPITPTNSSSTRSRRLRKAPPVTQLRRSNSEPLLVKENGLASRSRSLLRKASFKSSSRLRLADFPGPSDESLNTDVYWPLDFLPSSCPNSRIFMWGYHTLVVDQKPLRLQGDIFAHASELLLELASTRVALGTRARPMVFVAHSTGGILVKEALRLADNERDGPLKEVLLSTSAVIFLSCPHRATDNYSLGDAIKSMASVTLPIDSNDPVLQQLCGANSIEAELGRQTFFRLWNDYNFKVKTFQEAVFPCHRDSELQPDMTLRRSASFIGDPRENAQTIGALHENICKFSSMEDPGYQCLASSLVEFVQDEEERRHIATPRETECFQAIMGRQPAPRESHPATSYPGTCLWLYNLYDFQAWHHRSGPNANKVLWIRGESGCGKTILLRSLRRMLNRQWEPAGGSIIWTTAEGSNTSVPIPGISDQQQDISPAQVYRNILAQLFHQDPGLRKALLSLYNHPQTDRQAFDDGQIVSFFADYYVKQKINTPVRRTFIIVEIPDDAGSVFVEDIISRLSQLAQNSDFSICVASAYHPEIEQPDAISIPMHLRNTDDILRYVNLNLIAEWEERNQTVMMIGQKSGGVFLWAEIVVNILNAAITEGATQELVEYTLEEVPGDLHGLYEWMLGTLNETERAESLILFQWVMVAAEPMRLNDLFVAVRLTEPSPLGSWDRLGPLMALDVEMPFSMRDLRRLRNSQITSDTPDQFHSWLRARSIGLLELKSDDSQPLVNEPLGLQRVQPIHSSVRSFFLSGRGFSCLASKNSTIPSPLTAAEFIDISHYTLLKACLTYLNMRDFESLGHNHRSAAADNKSAGSLKVDTISWQQPTTVSSQRHLIMSSYPFLQYAVDNLLFHMLSPQYFRYFLPQNEILSTFSANKFRLWKRWTSLLGTYDPDAIVTRHTAQGRNTEPLLSSVFGARFRLERVLKTLGRLSTANNPPLAAKRKGISSPITPIAPAGGLTPKSSTREKGKEKEWKPRTPKFRLPPNLTLPIPTAVGGSLMSPLKMVPVNTTTPLQLGEPQYGNLEGGVGVGLAV